MIGRSGHDSGENAWSVHVVDESTIKIAGELDFTGTPKARGELMEAAMGLAGALRIDLSELDYMDSSGLAVMLELRKRVTSKGRELEIIGIRDQVRKIFMLTQVGHLFGLE